MAVTKQGRKKHIVEQQAKDIQKSTTATGLGKVSKSEGFLASILKLFGKKK